MQSQAAPAAASRMDGTLSEVQHHNHHHGAAAIEDRDDSEANDFTDDFMDSSASLLLPADHGAAGGATLRAQRRFSSVSSSSHGRRGTSAAAAADAQPPPSESYAIGGPLLSDRPHRNRWKAALGWIFSHKLSEWSGVYVPGTLAVFGPILFLRLAAAIASCGLYLVLAMILIIAVILAIAISATATIVSSGPVTFGGAYFLISRTLGPELGSTVGTMLFIVHILSAAFSVTGFTAIMSATIDDPSASGSGFANPEGFGYWMNFLVGSITILFALVVSLIGFRFYARVAVLLFLVKTASVLLVLGSLLFRPRFDTLPYVPIPNTTMTMLVGSLVGDDPVSPVTPEYLFTGPSRESLQTNLTPNFSDDSSSTAASMFLDAFGLLFSAFTGVLAGTNLSSEVVNPQRSIPRGMALASTTAVVTFISLAITIAACVTSLFTLSAGGLQVLLERLCVSQYIVFAGVTCSTVGASIFHLQGAARVLFRMCEDGVMPLVTRQVYRLLFAISPRSQLASASSFATSSSVSATGRESVVARRSQAYRMHRQRSPSSLRPSSAEMHSVLNMRLSTGSSQQNTPLLQSYDDVGLLHVQPDTPFVPSIQADTEQLQGVQENNLLGTNPLTDAVTDSSRPTAPPIFEKWYLVFCWFCVQCALFAGRLDVIAPIVTLLFLLLVAVLNAGVLILFALNMPNFRPRYRYHTKPVAAIGVLLPLATMFAIDITISLSMLAIATVVFVVFTITVPSQDWGDITQAVLFHQIRKYLLRITSKKAHDKYWRPSLLVVEVTTPAQQHPRHVVTQTVQLRKFANAIKKGGLLIISRVVLGEYLNSMSTRQQELDNLNAFIDDQKVKAFSIVVVAQSARTGLEHLLQSAGLGTMRPNLAVLHWPAAEQIAIFAGMIRDVLVTDLHFMLAKNFANFDFERAKRIAKKAEALQPSRLLQSSSSPSVEPAARFSNRAFRANEAQLNERRSPKMHIDVWTCCISTAATELHHGTRWAGYHDSFNLCLQLTHTLRMAASWGSTTRMRLVSVVLRDRELDAEYHRLQVFLDEIHFEADILVVSLENELKDSLPPSQPDEDYGRGSGVLDRVRSSTNFSSFSGIIIDSSATYLNCQDVTTNSVFLALPIERRLGILRDCLQHYSACNTTLITPVSQCSPCHPRHCCAVQNRLLPLTQARNLQDSPTRTRSTSRS
ncbi:hypothetical protein CAOG_00967 [Capsaspora owczarzaki ATCC 30864]|uniref:hypothetical protein n=1 Tax=Capsaspora owczarzaki (strain ATCC 30864) TaxID=595528 RepID=UPI0003522240|nr:hypothetical protein CAOG_00967 [Capsaspora owczarzaki ATCC 30864]|eukprot:XP_004365838.2 hypothetical protein CAOG_00967 [Capsaspora owczarzaki ATCC 30864]